MYSIIYLLIKDSLEILEKQHDEYVKSAEI